MIPTLLQGIHVLFGTHLGVWAPQLHAAVLSLLLAAWIWPSIAEMFRHLPKSQPGIEWVMLWRCPQCNTFNRRSSSKCTHCEYSLKVGKAGALFHDYLEWLQHSGKKFLEFYSFFGWIVFYGLTIFAVYKLRLYTFHQNHLLELLASITLAFLLLSLWFFYQAFRPQMKSPLNALMDGVTGLVLSVLLFLSAVSWVEATIQPNQPLATLQTMTNNQIELKIPRGGASVRINAIPIEKSLQFDFQYTVLDWPFLGIRHVFMTRFSGNPLMPGWQLSLNDLLGSPIKKESAFKPRLIILSQTFKVHPKTSYLVYEAKPSLGLALHTNPH